MIRDDALWVSRRIICASNARGGVSSNNGHGSFSSLLPDVRVADVGGAHAALAVLPVLPESVARRTVVIVIANVITSTVVSVVASVIASVIASVVPNVFTSIVAGVIASVITNVVTGIVATLVGTVIVRTTTTAPDGRAGHGEVLEAGVNVKVGVSVTVRVSARELDHGPGGSRATVGDLNLNARDVVLGLVDVGSVDTWKELLALA